MRRRGGIECLDNYVNLMITVTNRSANKLNYLITAYKTLYMKFTVRQPIGNQVLLPRDILQSSISEVNSAPAD